MFEVIYRQLLRVWNETSWFIFYERFNPRLKIWTIKGNPVYLNILWSKRLLIGSLLDDLTWRPRPHYTTGLKNIILLTLSIKNLKTSYFNLGDENQQSDCCYCTTYFISNNKNEITIKYYYRSYSLLPTNSQAISCCWRVFWSTTHLQTTMFQVRIPWFWVF